MKWQKTVMLVAVKMKYFRQRIGSSWLGVEVSSSVNTVLHILCVYNHVCLLWPLITE